jgi:uncharacterized Tic20 family protein
MNTTTDQRKLLSALCHGAILFGASLVSIGLPIVILLVSDDPVVKDNAKESLNFHINLYLGLLICFILMFALIGFPLLILLAIASWVLPIIAIIKVLDAPDRPYRYPFIFRLV